MKKFQGKLTGASSYDGYIIELREAGNTSRLGSARPDESGAFTVEVARGASVGGSKAALAKLYFDVVAPGGTVVSTRGVVPPSMKALPRISVEEGCFGGRTLKKGQFVVHGRLTNCCGCPLAGYRISAFDEDISHVENDDVVGDPLGSAVTDADGYYCIFYSASDFVKSEFGVADLRLTVHVGRGRRPLHTTRTRFNAGARLLEDPCCGGMRAQIDPCIKVDIELPPTARQCDDSEYRRLLRGLYQLLTDFPRYPARHKRVSRLTERELDFAANELSEDREKLVTLRRAHQIRWLLASAPTQRVDPITEQFYGLLRQGLPDNPGRWARLTAEQITTILDQVWDQCCVVLPDSAKAQLGTFVPAAIAAGIEAWLDEPVRPERSTRRELIQTVLSGSVKILAFAKIWLENNGREALETAINAGPFSDGEKKKLHRLLVYAAIADFYAEMTKEMVGLSEADLAVQERSDWVSVLPGDSVPDRFYAPRRRDEYVELIMARIRRRFGRLAVDSALGNPPSWLLTALPGLQRAVDAALDPTFDIRRTVLDELVDQFDGTEEEKRETLNALKTVQRLTRLGLPLEFFGKALEEGYTSAGSIAGRHPRDFLTDMQIPPRTALRIHGRARQGSAIAVGTRFAYGAMLAFAGSSPKLRGFPVPSGDRSKLGDAGFTAIFRGGTLCDCPEWRSVISPGAYLDSLLYFLEHRTAGGYAEYAARREDLLSLRVDHANTYTSLPHIDLVIETLEDEVRADLDSTIDFTAEWEARQTSRRSDELRLAPEFPQSDVYDDLAAASRPWTLLTSAPHFEITALLKVMGVARCSLVQDLEDDTTAEARLRLTKAALNASDTDYEALKIWNDWANTVRELYGENASDLKNVAVLVGATRSALDVPRDAEPGTAFVSLYQLLSRRFIEVGRGTRPFLLDFRVVGAPAPPATLRPVALVDVEGHACSPARLQLPNLRQAHLKRLHQLARLHRTLPWELRLLDHALVELLGADTQLTDDVLERLARVEILRRESALDAESAVLMSASFDPGESNRPFEDQEDIDPQWRRIFLPRKHFSRAQTVLTVDAVARAAGVDPDFAANRLGTFAENVIDLSVEANRDTALELCRWGRLAGALAPWDAESLAGISSWSGTDAFKTGEPKVALAFFRTIQALNEAGVDGPTLRELFGPKRPLADTDRASWQPTGALLRAYFGLQQALVESEDALRLGDRLRAVLGPDVAAHVVELLRADPLSAVAASSIRADLGFDAAALPLMGATVADRMREVSVAFLQREFRRGVVARLFRDTVLAEASDNRATDLAEGVFSALDALATPPATGFSTAGVGATLDWGPESLLVNLGEARSAEFAVDFKLLLPDPGQYALEMQLGTAAGAVAESSVELRLEPFVAPPGGEIISVAAGGKGTLSNEDELLVEISGRGGRPGIRDITVHLRGTRPEARSTFPVDDADFYDFSARFTLISPDGTRTLLTQTVVSQAQAHLNAVRARVRELLDRVRVAESCGLACETILELRREGIALPVSVEGSAPATDEWDTGAFAAWRTFEPWGRLLNPLSERQQLNLLEIHRRDKAGSLSLEEAATGLADVWAVSETSILDILVDVLDLTGTIDSTNSLAAGSLTPVKLVEARRRLVLADSAGGNFASLTEWTGSNPSRTDAAGARALTLQRFGSDKVREIADALRIRKRDTLVDYLIASRDDLSTPADVSRLFLINVEMQPPAETSRVRAAFMAAQRLVRQAIEQKEAFVLAAEDRRFWEQVMKTHPVWAGVRLLLLFPENVIYTRERYLRHLGYSDAFARFENRLMQGRLSADESREALEQYVEDLHEVGHLELVGIYHEREVQTALTMSTDTVHFVGRTASGPRAYYHRTFVDGAYWTPWSKIELDIDSDHVLPVVHNRRLHLFWPLLEVKKQDTEDVPDSDDKNVVEDSYLTVRFAWTEYTSRGWRPKSVSNDRWSTRFQYSDGVTRVPGPFGSGYVELRRAYQTEQDASRISLRPSWDGNGDLVVEVYARTEALEILKSDLQYNEAFESIVKVLTRVAQGSFADEFSDAVEGAMEDAVSSALVSLRSRVMSGFGSITPAFAGRTSTGTSRRRSSKHLLCAKVHLSPDRAVSITSRRDLTSTERSRTLDLITQTTVRNNGLAERKRYAADGLYLHLGDGDQVALAETPGEPVLTVSRQEEHPSETHPVGVKIGARSFFAMQEGPTEEQSAGAGFPKYINGKGAVVRAPESEIVSDPTVSVPIEASVALVPRAYSSADHQPSGRAVAMSTAHLVAELYSQPPTRTEPKWRFVRNYHTFSLELLRRVGGSSRELFDSAAQLDPIAALPLATPVLAFADEYKPNLDVVVKDVPEDGIAFDFGEPFATFNWELLHHAPLLIANQLTRNGRYQEARDWIKFVFDPDEATIPIEPANAWKFAPFHRAALRANTGMLDDLVSPDEDKPWKQRTFNGLITRWRRNPYDPHAAASFRPDSYQRAAFFQFVENLLLWGDSLFVIPNPDLIDEAADYYAEAAELLGRAPENLGPLRRPDEARTVEDLRKRASDWNYENVVAADVGESPAVPDEMFQEFNLEYFCIPPNPKLAELRAWADDRLFKVHHVLDLEGRPRKLPLFLPPIDPALLAAAGAAGLDASAVIADAFAPRPHYRFVYLLEVAREFAADVRELGAGLLAAMEKRDAAKLEVLRATHESAMSSRLKEVRALGVDEAKANLEAVERSRATVKKRKEFYEKREFMNTEEKAQLGLSIVSTILRATAGALNFAQGLAGVFPDVFAGAAGFGGSPVAVVKTGGGSVARGLGGIAQALSVLAQLTGDVGGIVGTVGGYRRRQEEWDFQADTAKSELKQFEKQLVAGQLRVAMAEHELQSQEFRADQAKEVLDLIRGKVTGEDRYEWMLDRLRALHRNAFDLAVRMARQAEKAMQFELATDHRIIGFGQWDNTRDGMLSGETLRSELSALRNYYIDNHRRPQGKDLLISLAEINPVELAKLKTEGECTFDLDESLFDLTAPGQYRRRIHRLSLNVKGVTGAAAGVHGSLALLKSSYRKTATPADPYPRNADGNDPRFVDLYTPRDVIEISTGRGDTGVPEEERSDQRYMPFEGAGAISKWKLRIPQDQNAFPINRIADVELRIWVSAAEGGAPLRDKAIAARGSRTNVTLISVEAQFPAEWKEWRDNGTPMEIDMSDWLDGDIDQVVAVVRGDVADSDTIRITVDGTDSGAVDLEPPAEAAYADLAALSGSAAAGVWTVDLSSSGSTSLMLLVRLLQ